MPTGTELIETIDRVDAFDDRMAFWWIGQHGFILKLGGKILYLDPFLSDSPQRTVRPLLEAPQIRHADIIIGSHDHGDHIDRKVWPELARASAAATFVAPALICRGGLGQDLQIDEPRLHPMDDGDTFQAGQVQITALPSAHEQLERDPKTGLHPYLGFIIESGPWRIYHPGDTTRYEGLETRLQQFGRIDLAFLPINGRDAQRLADGCIGNMVYQEAVDLAGHCGMAVAGPAH